MLRIGADFAFEVHVVALLYVLRVQSAAQMQLYLRRDWWERERKKKRENFPRFFRVFRARATAMKYFGGKNARGIPRAVGEMRKSDRVLIRHAIIRAQWL